MSCHTQTEQTATGSGSSERLLPLAKDIQMQFVGRVECDLKHTAPKMNSGWPAVIRVQPQYEPALHRIEESSHLWVLCWFHESQRNLFRVKPGRMDATLPEYGVFALRCPVRPNPISLTAVKLEKVAGNLLYVSGLDAIDGTLVLDIKPYFSSDVIFSARVPYLRASDRERRREMYTQAALNYHGEDCACLRLGVRMTILAEDYCGHLQDDRLRLTVSGPACLADVLQGLTRSRLANPPRFVYLGERDHVEVHWTQAERNVHMAVKSNALEQAIFEVADEELFVVTVS
ncbi:MAG TPA: tRNA (N6-threonylcarbamoyladenosine(37)-N6)-methyltransferase TrmO [Patescibacteria group bacterium]|nr:tRNA (N6-threonylcarbamoyladenosine(37)-N6)-methyltransferase TrmO [Patescibacteria group bacterium]